MVLLCLEKPYFHLMFRKIKEKKVIEILKKYEDGIIITSKIDNSGARITKQ